MSFEDLTNQQIKNIYSAYASDPENEENTYLFCLSNYQPMLDAIGNVLVQKEANDYQGDTLVLYGDSENGSWYGVLVFGWGSCSGCDALQACRNWADVQSLYEKLKGKTFWGSRDDVVNYLRTHDWLGGEYVERSLAESFVRESLACLGEQDAHLFTIAKEDWEE